MASSVTSLVKTRKAVRLMAEFLWRGMIPLSCRDAHKTLKKGLDVYALRPNGKSVKVRSRLGIKLHARTGGCFGVNKEAFIRAFSEYDAIYHIYGEPYDPVHYEPENCKARVQVHCPNFDEILHSCYETLTKAAKEAGLADGKYYATQSLATVCCGEELYCAYDEGDIIIKDGAVVDAPCSFTLPF